MVQSLVEQLQMGAVDGSSPITDLLRKAKLAAVKLDVSDFAGWVDLEMGGYTLEDTMPSYRVVRGALKYLNPSHGWRPIPGAEGLETNVYQPIGEVLDLSKTKAGFAAVTVPSRIRQMVKNDLGIQLDIQMHIPCTAIAAIVEAVRNDVLEWTLKLEKAGINGHGFSFTAEEKKAAQRMVVTNHYHGPVASVAHGRNSIHGISQTNASATPREIADAVGLLIRAINADDQTSLKSAETIADLASAHADLKEGRVPVGKLTKILDVLSKTGDVAMRAPEVASRLHQLGQMLGLC
jgi:hypothetical protein